MMLAFYMPGWPELVLLAGVGLLIFGKRLPEVGRSLGKGIIEFKKGLSGIQDDIENASSSSSPKKQIDTPEDSIEVDTKDRTANPAASENSSKPTP